MLMVLQPKFMCYDYLKFLICVMIDGFNSFSFECIERSKRRTWSSTLRMVSMLSFAQKKHGE